jgi:uncharacterized protein YbaR (Trm112 family)
MMTMELIDILRCPKTRQRVEQAEPALLQKLNDQIRAGLLKNFGGRVVTGALEGALVTADGKHFYPVRQSLPIMLWDEAIATPG